MRRYIILGFVILIPFLFGSIRHADATKDSALVLRVTSEDPKESLTFEGCYLFKVDEERFETIKQQTPFETQANAEFVAAMFHKTSGKGCMVVELLTRTGDKEHMNLSGTSNNLILTTNTREKPFTHLIQTAE